MKKRVKITTLEWVLDIIFPCYCRGCGKIGSAFCERCIFDNMKNNIVLGNHSDYYDDDTVNSAGIVRERLNVGTRDLLIEKNQRQAKFIDRSLLDEMRYDACDARDYIDAAINNVATEMQIRKIQEHNRV